MKILITGNGFDLEHEMKTSYGDFIEFCDKIDKNPSYINEIFDKIKRKIRNSTLNDEKKNALVKKYDDQKADNLKRSSNQNFWLKCVKHYNMQPTECGQWMDFEKIINKVIITANFLYINGWEADVLEEYKKDAEVLKNISEEYMPMVDFSDQNISKKVPYEKEIGYILAAKQSLNDLLELLNIYMDVIVDCNKKPRDVFENLKPDYVLTFNYTNTYNMIYNKDTECHFIHGKCNILRERNKNDMVLGMEYSVDLSLLTENLIVFQKYYQRIVKRTGNNYSSWLNSLNNLDGKATLYFYGHSFNASDGDVLKELIKHENVEKSIIFYHDEKSFHSIVINLIKILGQEYIINSTHNETIEFIDIRNKEDVS